MQQRERNPGREESLACQMQHDTGILADRIEHDRLAEFGRNLAQDLDRFSLEATQMRPELATGRRGGLCRIATDGGSELNFVRAPSGLGDGRLFRPGSGSHLKARHVHDHVPCKTRRTTPCAMSRGACPWISLMTSS